MWYISILQFEEVNKDKKTQRIIWSHPGTDVTGMVARSEKVAGTCEKVLEWKSKFQVLKETAFCIFYLEHVDKSDVLP